MHIICNIHIPNISPYWTNLDFLQQTSFIYSFMD